MAASCAEQGQRARIAVAHVVASLDPIHGGPSYSVPRLCRALEGQGAEVRLYSVLGAGEGPPVADNVDGLFDVDWKRVPVLRQMCWSSGLVRELQDIAPDVGLIHSHGLWQMPNVAAAHAAAHAGKPVVVSPRGMLGPAALAFSRRKKRLFWLLFQRNAIGKTTCLHATSAQEYAEIREFGLLHPVAIVPNGIDMPGAAGKSRNPNGDRVVLSLGRLHPKKGLDRLIRAWALIEATHPDWRMRIIGPDRTGHADELRQLAQHLGVTGVSVEPPLVGEAKLAAYRQAELFVLPTLNDNFASTVAEALAAGTPVIASRGSPWRGLEDEGCGWWVDHGVETLAAALKRAMALPAEQLAVMGQKGRNWMARDFSWQQAAETMMAVYGWLLDGGEPPACLRLQ